MRRTQIYLDDEQAAQLDERAAGEGVTRSTMIRRAIDDFLARDERDLDAWRIQWSKAVMATSGSAPDLPEGADYVEELRAADAARLGDRTR